MGELCQCDYRVRLGENSQWCPLSTLARNRVNKFLKKYDFYCVYLEIDCSCV
jgi:hypothetical protein